MHSRQRSILIVEDTPTQAQLLESQLTIRYPGVHVWRISSESEFREKFGAIAEAPPDSIIMDIIIKWAQPVPSLSVPSEPLNRRRAGIRCQRMLADDLRTQNIPVILCTVLTPEELEDDMRELPRNRKFVAKQDGLDTLFAAIDETLKLTPTH